VHLRTNTGRAYQGIEHFHIEKSAAQFRVVATKLDKVKERA
jgi:GTP-binding protein EngB required for normal cell division